MGDEIGSEKAYREGTRRAPASATCYASLGYALGRRKDFIGAEIVYRKGIKNFPTDGDLSDLGELFKGLGELLDDMGDTIGAEKVKRDLDDLCKRDVWVARRFGNR
jgi:uncharacterized protein HemY